MIRIYIWDDVTEAYNTETDHVNNTGTLTWNVQSVHSIIIPRVWHFALVDDTTGFTDSSLQLQIDDGGSTCTIT